MSGFSAFAGPLLIPLSISAIAAKAIVIDLPIGRFPPSDPLSEPGKAPATGSKVFISLRNIIGFPYAWDGVTGSDSSNIHTVGDVPHRAGCWILSAGTLAATANRAMPT